MDSTPAGIESELLDLSTVDVGTLRSLEVTGMTDAMTRVRNRIADAEGSISGYSGSFASPIPVRDLHPAEPSGPQAKDQTA
jgi:hypothetical protein